MKEGFDVWMGNNRGCRYSVAHTTLNPESRADKPAYWDFDFEEMGLYDLPAEIDFILNNTGNAKVTFIGHSMGAT